MSTSSSSLTSPLSSLERRRWSSSLGKQQRCATTRVSRPLFFFFAKECFFFIRVLERDFDEEGCVFSVLDMMMMMMLLEMMRVLVRAVL